MSKYLITLCTLGLLNIPMLQASAIKEAREVEAPLYLTTASSVLISDLTMRAASELKLFQTQSAIKKMSAKERKELTYKLSLKSSQLETIIPKEHQQEAAAESCCFIFWSSCFKISAKTLGSLALDLIMDVSDGKLDGKGPEGSIDYIHHIVEIVNATIEEAKLIASR